MRGSKTMLMLGAALLFGGAAAYLAVDWINSQVSHQVAGQSSATLRKVASAAADLRAGKELAASDLTTVQWPASTVPEGAVMDAAALVGRVLRSSVAKGEPLSESRLAAKGVRGGIASLIAPGKRAISISVNDAAGMASYALEGSFVDIIVNSMDAAEGDRQRSMSKIVLERVLVLRTSPTAQGDGRIGAVTLEVTPAEAETLDLARSVGTLSLALRSESEGEQAKTKGATKESLFGLNYKPATAPVPVAQPAIPPVAAVSVPAVPRPAVVKEVVRMEPAVASAKPLPAKTCVDALIGNERRSECF